MIAFSFYLEFQYWAEFVFEIGKLKTLITIHLNLLAVLEVAQIFLEICAANLC